MNVNAVQPLGKENFLSIIDLVLNDIAPKVFDESQKNDMQDLDRSVFMWIKACLCNCKRRGISK